MRTWILTPATIIAVSLRNWRATQNYSEEQVALAAVEFARSAEDKTSMRKSHVGFYLIDAGRATLENSINYQPGFRVRVQRALLAFPTATYLGSIAFLSVLFVLGLLAYATLSGGSPAPTHYRWCAWAWIGFGSRHHDRALECNSSHQAAKPAAHGFFGGHSSGQPYDGGCANSVGKRRGT